MVASGDRHQRSSISAPVLVPAQIVGVPEAKGASAPVPSTRPKSPKREGLSLLSSPVLDDEFGTTYELDVIAIHGLNGHPRDTWTSGKADDGVFWLQDLLPKALPGARIFTYGYDSRLFWSPSTGDIDTYAKVLLDCLNLERPQSSASLIIANEKQNRYQSILDSTRAIFFFGTPHRGSDFADTAHVLSTFVEPFNSELLLGKGKSVRSDLLQDLAPKSKTLEKLCDAFVDRADQVECITTFYEVNEMRGRMIVPRSSAVIGIANENATGIARDHSQICRIRDEDELSYRMIVENCQKLGTGLPEKLKQLNLEEQQCLNSLALSIFTEPPGTEIFPAKDTCEWILSVQQFNTWRNGLPPVLWISGELGNKDLANATAILHGLVWDIVSQRHDLIHHALRHYNSSRAWTYLNLWRVFQGILNDPHTSSVYVIIDALDECDRKDRVNLLRDLGKYLENKSNTAANCRINFVLSSRPAIIGILPGLKAKPSYLELDQDPDLIQHMATDIRRFVLDDLLSDNQFSSRHDPDGSVRLEALADKIATKSDGSFLWASLILKDLHAISFIGEVEDFISKCPPDLYGVYWESLAKVGHNRRKVVVKSLHIMLAARRPLTVAEFKFALAVESEHQTLETLQRAIEERLENIFSYLQDILGSLIRITETTITLRHQSVKDFLLNRLGAPQDSRQPKTQEYSSDLNDAFRMSMNDAENTLAECCVGFLNLEDFAKKRSSRDEDREIWADSGLGAMYFPGENTPKSPDSVSYEYDRKYREPQTPFFEYAASNWGLHYASCEPAGERLTNTTLKLSTRTNTLVNWSHQFRRSYWGCDNLPESLDALIVAAYFGQTTMVTRLTSNNDFKSSWSAALTWASRMGHPDIVKILIELGTPCIGEMLDGRSAFSWATASGFLEIVDMLLGCDRDLINVKENSGCCPLILAADSGHLEMVEKLLGSEDIDVNLRSNDGAAPIHFAINGPNHSTTELEILRKLLCDSRVDITVRDRHDRSFLSYAAEYGATEAIQELLNSPERQGEIERLLDDKGDEKGLSPLSYAAWMGRSDTVRLLCKTKRIDSQLRSVDKLDGANVFHLAAKRQHVKVIRELGNYYREGGTSADILHALLDLGAKINLADFNRKTPISYGVEKIELVKALVDRGADLNLPDKDGHTPLWWARHKDGNLQAQLMDLGARL
ncbi:MAG: hypothetical protein ASARMPRED_000737 [Alectoria sarmentosa]|nr:MAG: hypothetical protein ASARMPRED_000737 [Alectoria sarmentosa]